MKVLIKDAGLIIFFNKDFGRLFAIEEKYFPLRHFLHETSKYLIV